MSSVPGADDAVAPSAFHDPLAALVSRESQRSAALTAQDAFARLFRASLVGGDAEWGACVAESRPRLDAWVSAGGTEDARALRLALLISGMDQWGLAYSQAFGLTAIPALSALIGTLRTALDPVAEARFQQQFAALDADEAAAIDFKIELRRHLHLALWHAAIASETREEALRIAQVLGNSLLALMGQMPTLGWRLAADTLAHIQIRCLSEGLAADGIGQEATQALFAGLRQALPADDHGRMLAHAGQAVVAWQRAQVAGATAGGMAEKGPEQGPGSASPAVH